MGVLDQIMHMQSQGKSDSEIIRALQERGIPPREIQDAINQAQVKRAISPDVTEGMQQSIMETPQDEMAPEYNEEYAEVPQNQEYLPQSQEPQAYQEPYQDYYAGNQGYGEEGYGGYSYTPGTSDTSTLMEIAEQVFSEKIKKIQKSTEELSEFKILTESKIKLFEERLKRIESTIDQLQISILEKVGSYGQNLSSIKKEMSMMQDSFSKVINPLLDRKSRKD